MIFSLTINDTDQSDPDAADEPDPSTAGFFRPDHDPPLLNLQSLIINLYSLFPLD
jgi:hypothetical protein